MLSYIILFLSLVYAAPVPFNLLKSIVAPVAVASSFSNLGNLPSRSIALSQNLIHSQITNSHFGAISSSSRRDQATRIPNTLKMIVGGDNVNTKQFPFYAFAFNGKGVGGGTMIAPNVMLTAGIII